MRLGQSSGVDDVARVAASATALQHPWLVDILNNVKTFPAAYPTFLLLLDQISDALLQRRSAPAPAPAPGPAPARAPAPAPGTAKLSLYTNNRLTFKQLLPALVVMLANGRDFQSSILAASKRQDFPAAARDLHPRPTISQPNHVTNKLVHTLTAASAVTHQDVLKSDPQLLYVQEGILGYHAVLISQIASQLSADGTDGRTLAREYT
jgi:hypothetical protein